MKPLRTLLFWAHLLTGAVAGVVILLMSLTGVALTFEKQFVEWADQRQVEALRPRGGAPALGPEAVLARVTAALPGAVPTGLTWRAEPSAPLMVALAGTRAVLVDPASGDILGEPAAAPRAFFRAMTNWHRWLALDGASRATGRAVTGAANLGFLFVVLSGMYLWVPRLWTRLQFAQVLWFRRGLSARARDFNWHNVTGIWAAVPLALIVAAAVPMSYPWAGDLVYRMAGEAPPAPAARRARPDGADDTVRLDVSGLDAAWRAAQAQVPSWRTMNVRVDGPRQAPFVISLDGGSGGQPQLRRTLTIDRATAVVITTETFADLSPGRRVRTWLRFVHTGEFYGVIGQTIAGLVSAAAAVLVYTGSALALRRWAAWRRRRRAPRADTPAAA